MFWDWLSQPPGCHLADHNDMEQAMNLNDVYHTLLAEQVAQGNGALLVPIHATGMRWVEDGGRMTYGFCWRLFQPNCGMTMTMLDYPARINMCMCMYLCFPFFYSSQLKSYSM
jgi:hypothetical protein